MTRTHITMPLRWLLLMALFLALATLAPVAVMAGEGSLTAPSKLVTPGLVPGTHRSTSVIYP